MVNTYNAVYPVTVRMHNRNGAGIIKITADCRTDGFDVRIKNIDNEEKINVEPLSLMSFLVHVQQGNNLEITVSGKFDKTELKERADHLGSFFSRDDYSLLD